VDDQALALTLNSYQSHTQPCLHQFWDVKSLGKLADISIAGKQPGGREAASSPHSDHNNNEANRMDRFSITDRLESTTPVRNPGPENSSRGDSQPRRRKPATPKTEGSELNPDPQTPADSNDEQNSHQLDELA